MIGTIKWSIQFKTTLYKRWEFVEHSSNALINMQVPVMVSSGFWRKKCHVLMMVHYVITVTDIIYGLFGDATCASDPFDYQPSLFHPWLHSTADDHLWHSENALLRRSDSPQLSMCSAGCSLAKAATFSSNEIWNVFLTVIKVASCLVKEERSPTW